MNAYINKDGKLVIEPNSYEDKYAICNAIEDSTPESPFYICDDKHLIAREEYLTAQREAKEESKS